MRFASLLMAFGLIGCNELIGAGDYDVAQASAAPGAPGNRLYDATCMDCVRANCTQQLDDCVADNECRRVFECTQRCTDPGCWTRCGAPDYGPWKNWPPIDIETCMIGHCVDLCAYDTEYDCADYSFANVYEDGSILPVSVTVEDLFSSARQEGWEVKACKGDPPCTAVTTAAVGTSDKNGLVTLDLPVRKSGFNGFFEVSNPAVTSFVYTENRDMPYNTYWDRNVLGVDPAELGVKLFQDERKQPPPEDFGALIYEVSSCHVFPADGVVVEVDPPADLWIFYPSGKDETAGDGAPHRDPAYPVAPFIAVAGSASVGELALTFRQKSTGRVIRRRNDSIRAGVFTVRRFAPQGELLE